MEKRAEKVQGKLEWIKNKIWRIIGCDYRVVIEAMPVADIVNNDGEVLDAHNEPRIMTESEL